MYTMIQNFFKAAIFIVLVYACNPNNVKNDTAIAQLMDSAGNWVGQRNCKLS